MTSVAAAEAQRIFGAVWALRLMIDQLGDDAVLAEVWEAQGLIGSIAVELRERHVTQMRERTAARFIRRASHIAECAESAGWTLIFLSRQDSEMRMVPYRLIAVIPDSETEEIEVAAEDAEEPIIDGNSEVHEAARHDAWVALGCEDHPIEIPDDVVWEYLDHSQLDHVDVVSGLKLVRKIPEGMDADSIIWESRDSEDAAVLGEGYWYAIGLRRSS